MNNTNAIRRQTGERAKLGIAIDKILWEDWDPIGVNDIAPRDEYQSYVPQILNMAMNNETAIAIAERLNYIATVTMGLTENKEKCIEVAEKIVGCFSVINSDRFRW